MYLEIWIALLPCAILLWVLSLVLKNASIVDIFWGLGFIFITAYYYYFSGNQSPRAQWIFYLVTIWGLRLSVFLAIRNGFRHEDYRYQAFRQNYGASRYWWISFFQVFLLQSVLMWLLSSTLYLSIQSTVELNLVDYIAMIIIGVSIYLEAKADSHLYHFKQNPANKGKTFRDGLWKYSRHPNYFFESMVWFGFSLISIAAEVYWGILSYGLMLVLLLKVSGVSLLEKSLIHKREDYGDYQNEIPAFFPRWRKK